MLNIRFWTLFTLTAITMNAVAAGPMTGATNPGKAVEMMVDGVFYTAEEVLELQKLDPYRDVIRFYVYDENAAADGLIYGFTNLAYFREYLAETDREPVDEKQLVMPDELDRNEGIRTKASMVFYYDNTNFVGPTGAISSGTARCLYNSDIWFNDRIESVLTTACNCTWTILRMDCGPGSSFWIAGGANVSDLGPAWNNQVSFIRVIQ